MAPAQARTQASESVVEDASTRSKGSDSKGSGSKGSGSKGSGSKGSGSKTSGSSASGSKALRSKVPAAATPWGPASVLEEVSVPQRAGDKRFAVLVQLLETREGDQLIRFAYTTSGSARRGPVTMRARDLERLRAALERAPVLSEVLDL